MGAKLSHLEQLVLYKQDTPRYLSLVKWHLVQSQIKESHSSILPLQNWSPMLMRKVRILMEEIFYFTTHAKHRFVNKIPTVSVGDGKKGSTILESVITW